MEESELIVGDLSKHPKIKNLIGKKFGKMTVISFYKYCSKTELPLWNCQCECGKYDICSSNSLKYQKFISCGKNPCRQRKFIDLTGNRYGKIVILSYSHYDLKRHFEYWNFKCDCGKIGKMSKPCINKSKSCGCGKNDKSRFRGKNHPRWHKDLTEKERLFNKRRTRAGIKKWRDKIFRRDNYTCQITGKKGDLCAHHIEAWATNKNLRFKIDNGITMLYSVHEYFHKIYGKGKNNISQLNEFIKNLTKEEVKNFN